MIERFENIDCYELLQQMPDKSIDLFLQDTPFGVTQNKWDVKPDLPKMWAEWKRVAKDNAAYLFFATQPFASELIMSNLKMFRYDLIWYKALASGFLNAQKMPLRNHESILVFYKSLPTFNPQMGIGKKKTKGRKDPKERSKNCNYGGFKDLGLHTNNVYFPESVIDFSNGDRQSENDHPTQKPLDLIRYLIRTYSNEGDAVFDGYAGSGTTGDACIIEKRRFYGAENDKEEGYYELACKRFAIAKQKIQLPFND